MKNAAVKSKFVSLNTSGVHNHAIEFVPNKLRPKAVYYVFDGKRVAKRKSDRRGSWWLCMPGCVPGYEVADNMSFGERSGVLLTYSVTWGSESETATLRVQRRIASNL
jgi:hypothetical protein